jgi:hypothetical protein
LVGCTKVSSVPNIELIQDMMEQPAIKAQKYDDFTEDGISSRVPPEHTQPLGYQPYPFEKDPVGAEKNKNPLAGNFSEETLLTGQNFFNTNCMVCHGTKALGNGPIKDSYPLPIPSLMSGKVRNMSDGGIFHIITMGQGTMGPYRSHIPQKYRWQVVQYIRHMQNQSKTLAGDRK